MREGEEGEKEKENERGEEREKRKMGGGEERECCQLLIKGVKEKQRRDGKCNE